MWLGDRLVVKSPKTTTLSVNHPKLWTKALSCTPLWVQRGLWEEGVKDTRAAANIFIEYMHEPDVRSVMIANIVKHAPAISASELAEAEIELGKHLNNLLLAAQRSPTCADLSDAQMKLLDLVPSQNPCLPDSPVIFDIRHWRKLSPIDLADRSTDSETMLQM